MKYLKIIVYMLSMYLIAGCSKESLDAIPVEDVWGAYSSRVDSLKEVISNTEYGWEFMIEDIVIGSGYAGFLGFEENTESSFAVDVDGKFIQKEANRYLLSVRKSNPSLIFESGSAFSDFAIQAGRIDTTYSYKYASGDTLFFQGDVFANSLKLFKTESIKATFYKSGMWETAITTFMGEVNQLINAPRFFNTITVGNKKADIMFDLVKKMLTVNYQEGTGVQTVVSGFYLTDKGLKFFNKDLINLVQVRGIEDIGFSGSQLTFDGGKIENISTPSAYDQDAARKFIHEAPTLWVTYSGFGRRNRPDIASIGSIPNFRFMIYRPKVAASGSTIYDRWGFFTGAWEPGSIASVSSITSDNLVKVEAFSSYNGTPGPAITSANRVMTPIMYNARGFYAIKYANGYYLVDARDALTWIFWEPEN